MTELGSHRYTVCEEQLTRLDCWQIARSLDHEPFLFLLDSADGSAELGRYSVLAWQPRWEFVAKDGVAWSGPPGAAEPQTGEVLAELDSLMAAFSAPEALSDAGMVAPPVFTGGAIGFFAYELLHEIESVTPNQAPDLGIADCHLLFCDLALVTDEATDKSWIVGNGWGNTECESRADCMSKIEIARTICAKAPARQASDRPSLDVARERLRGDDLEHYGIAAVTDPDRYFELVERAREHIFAGDVFELCLTQRFDTEFDGRGIDLYATMRSLNPAPMAAYLRFPELEVLSCSPERFLRVDEERWVETRPIKGTRPRGRTALEDEALAIDLATATKDGAENIMIVDLARNDLGRVCEFGTIAVPRLRAVERYSSVFQLVSTVRGRLRPDATPMQLLRAAFPGGSMTGAPKIEAMRLINRLEDSRRGVFSGAIGYINYSGELDLNIVIRTVVKRGDALSFHTGGAVTSDSVPTEEYQETLDKACALVHAIEVTRAAAKVSVAAQ
jgi:para-aminobenzoate synthetase component I